MLVRTTRRNVRPGDHGRSLCCAACRNMRTTLLVPPAHGQKLLVPLTQCSSLNETPTTTLTESLQHKSDALQHVPAVMPYTLLPLSLNHSQEYISHSQLVLVLSQSVQEAVALLSNSSLLPMLCPEVCPQEAQKGMLCLSLPIKGCLCCPDVLYPSVQGLQAVRLQCHMAIPPQTACHLAAPAKTFHHLRSTGINRSYSLTRSCAGR